MLRATCTILLIFIATQTLAQSKPLVHQTVVTDVYSAPQIIYGLATGDIDPSHPGLEVAVLLEDGSVTLLRPSAQPNLWAAESISLPTLTIGDMYFKPTIDIGDVHSAFPGNEIVIEAGQLVTCIHRDPDSGWGQQTIFDQTGAGKLTWGARVGDIDPTRPGLEVFKSWEGFQDSGFGSVLREVDGTWTEEIVYVGEVGMDAFVADLDPNSPGHEIITVTEMGPTYEIRQPGGGFGGITEWPRSTIWNSFVDAGWVLKVADIDLDTPGLEVAYGTRYNRSILLSAPTGMNVHNLDVLYRSENMNDHLTMWDIAVGQVVLASSHLEIVGVDHIGQVHLVTKLSDGWTGGVIHNATDSLYAVAIADLDSNRPGNELLVAGEKGKVTILAPQTPSDMQADLNGDHVVDLEDWQIFNTCFAGPATESTATDCSRLTNEYADLYHDQRVDLADFAIAARQFAE